MKKMKKIGIILCAFLCISIAVAGCSSAPQYVASEHRNKEVDTTISMTSAVNYNLEKLPDMRYEIEVTSNLPITIMAYDSSHNYDLYPPANQIYRWNGNFVPTDSRSGIVIMKPPSTKGNPAVSVKITSVQVW